jgi:hypothetical protein
MARASKALVKGFDDRIMTDGTQISPLLSPRTNGKMSRADSPELSIVAAALLILCGHFRLRRPIRFPVHH